MQRPRHDITSMTARPVIPRLGVPRTSAHSFLRPLAEKMDVDADTFAATIERCNEMARNGKDEDFNKRADRLFPVEEGPFYAFPIHDANLLVALGGLETTVDFQVIDTDDEPIEGLYAVGNAQGGRFLIDYPLLWSHSPVPAR